MLSPASSRVARMLQTTTIMLLLGLVFYCGDEDGLYRVVIRESVVVGRLVESRLTRR